PSPQPRSVFGNALVYFVRPRADAALDALHVFKALLAQELEGPQRPDTTFAMDVILLVRIELGESLLQSAHGEERDAVDMGDLVFVRLADIDDFDPELRVLHRALHFLDGDFIRVRARDLWLRGDAAEHFVIDQLGDGGILATHGAFRVATELQFTE